MFLVEPFGMKVIVGDSCVRWPVCNVWARDHLFFGRV